MRRSRPSWRRPPGRRHGKPELPRSAYSLARTITCALEVGMARAAAPTGLRGEVRLAELVAALSLGVDLGFGQPMEHVLRQCVIALRLSERLGLADQDRSVVYYSALLINVGCHSDAHEQAKWFGDDIALKSN